MKYANEKESAGEKRMTKEEPATKDPNAEAIKKIAKGFGCDYATAEEIFGLSDIVLFLD